MKVALIKWGDSDGITNAIHRELIALGNEVKTFRFDASLPLPADVILTFAPYGSLLHVFRQIMPLSRQDRPIFVHWNMESLPNPKLPWTITSCIASFRSWVDRLNAHKEGWVKSLLAIPPLNLVNRRMQKYRFLGDYHHYYREGWLDLLVDTSEFQAAVHRSHGVPAAFVPWGTSPEWYADLELERDIDVFWMGKQRTGRRARLLEELKGIFASKNINFYIADGVHNPLVFGDTRTELLNRSKITLNLLPTWYDTNFAFRFHMTAGNRSLVVSEPILSHCPQHEPGIHYVSAPTGRLSDTIAHYLVNADERKRITDAAYELVTERMTFRSSVSMLLEEIEQLRQIRNRP